MHQHRCSGLRGVPGYWLGCCARTRAPMIRPGRWIRILPIEQSAQVDTIVRGIDEWIGLGFRSDLKRRTFLRERLQTKMTFNSQLVRWLRERSDGYGIAEYIVAPAYRCRRRKLQIGFNEPKIVTVARAQHQPVIAEPNGTPITVGGRVPHIENGQMNASLRGRIMVRRLYPEHREDRADRS